MGTITREISGAMADFKSESDDHLLADGKELGKWRVLAFIDEGGNGEVYRVQNMEEEASFAALKILKLNGDKKENENARRRFENELKYLQEMKSASFPAYIDKGEFENRPYLVMEELRSLELPDDDEDVAEFMIQVCKGIRELHSRNIIHRDIKPKNIMCRADGTPVIVDLGLCKTGEETEDGHVKFAGGSISIVGGKPVAVGTPGNSAPEQFIEGKSNFSSDVCSLGILARQCFKRKVPNVWRPIINRATSAMPEQRYQSVKDLEEDIENRHLTAKGIVPVKPRDRWEWIILIACGLLFLWSSWCCVQDMADQNTIWNKGCYNVRARVADMGFLWDVIDSTNGWKLEKNIASATCRILDPNHVRVAWGPSGNMREMFDEILSEPEHHKSVDLCTGWLLMVAIYTFWISLILFLLVLQRKWLKRGMACVAKIMNWPVKLFNHSRNSD